MDFEVILQRIVDLANDLSGIGTASLTYPDDATMLASLPYVFIEDGEATYEHLHSDMWRITREVRSLIYSTRIDPETEATETTGRVTDRALTKAYTEQFLKRPRLQRNDSGVNGIVNATVISDGGPQTADRHRMIFTALDIRHRIIYDEQISEV
jgi:hypothetical protein